ncbi:putative ORFan [Tupanvirus deep ocean]|uniref:ORFan n=2 Tax=Tupanvirus TaxID=2094720 RepID=A0AC62A7J4_9VIRU|nr:putative ORFan [Tupanvirus deep ocean]QKU33751.1 putative ORFan [Tupanvirus deep ocean]
MPNQTDWILLKKTINNYKGDVAETWGYITEDNANVVCTNECHGKDLFDFLMFHEHFSDANTVASCISLFTEKNMQIIYEKHHAKYHDILKLLCTDRMILLYEQYHTKIHDENAGLTTDTIITEQESDFNNIYRTAISKRYEKMLCDKPPSNIIIEVINEFKFLTHPYLEDFYNFTLNIKNIEQITKFTDVYGKYMDFIPLVYRLINEYYLEYIKYQLKTIDDMFGSSFIIVSEYYENLKKCVTSLPKKYVDYRYKDKNGNNIMFYLITLPFLTENINKDIFEDFFQNNDDIPLDIRNTDGNTIFHYIALYENEIFFNILMEWIKQNQIFTSENEYYDKISELLKIENAFGKTVFDILLEKNSYVILMKIIEFMPVKSYLKITNKLIENFDIIEKIPNCGNINKIYFDSINYFMDSLHKMKKEILYDLTEYNDCKLKISKLLSKCSNEIDMNQEYCLEWLFICIKTNEFDLFKLILSKYFYNEQTNISKQYLNKPFSKSGESIIITAIKEQKVQFIKYLLNYDIDLLVCDKSNRNVFMAALETKNIYLIRLLREYIINVPLYSSMASITETFINLLEKHETFNTFSISDTLVKLWNTIEYFFNYLLNDFNPKENKPNIQYQ